ncbi:hypothetical protein ACMTN4_00640 (plasmid) [Rhodococcus globerulus]|uniref:hypothetical protein n=1 Tax=Rhodococcus globerulus TaxID=33008 RepID=UPI0039EBC4AF
MKLSTHVHTRISLIDLAKNEVAEGSGEFAAAYDLNFGRARGRSYSRKLRIVDVVKHVIAGCKHGIFGSAARLVLHININGTAAITAMITPTAKT